MKAAQLVEDSPSPALRTRRGSHPTPGDGELLILLGDCPE